MINKEEIIKNKIVENKIRMFSSLRQNQLRELTLFHKYSSAQRRCQDAKITTRNLLSKS